MRKHGACIAAVVAAVTLIGPTAIAAAHTRRNDANPGKHSFIVVNRHDQRVSLYVQHGRRIAAARAAACPPGGPFTNSSTACTPPVEQNLFGAYASSGGKVTFGSTTSSTCTALGWTGEPCGVYTRDTTLDRRATPAIDRHMRAGADLHRVARQKVRYDF